MYIRWVALPTEYYYNLGNRPGKCRTHLGISDGVILDNSVHRHKDV